jgi:plasmid stabilization system protein ParE
MTDPSQRAPRAILTRAVAQEIDAATRWYEERDADVAARFAAAMATALRAIVEAPKRWPLYHRGARGVSGHLPAEASSRARASAGVRRVLVKGFPYAVLYTVVAGDGAVRVVAVAHQARRPGYWRARVRDE